MKPPPPSTAAAAAAAATAAAATAAYAAAATAAAAAAADSTVRPSHTPLSSIMHCTRGTPVCEMLAHVDARATCQSSCLRPQRRRGDGGGGC